MILEITGFWPEHWSHERIIQHGIAEILTNQRKDRRDIMAAIDNLNTNIAKLKTDLEALIASKSAASEAAIQAGADAVAALDAEVVAALPAAPTA